MKSGKRLTVGYIAQHGYDGIGLELLHGIAKAAADYDLNLINFIGGSTLFDREVNQGEITVIKFLNSHSVDGIISWGTSLRHYMTMQAVEELHRRFRPLPIVGIAMPLSGIPAILPNDNEGIRELMVHLIADHGLRKIAFIGRVPGHFGSEMRYEAYRQILREYEIEFRPELVFLTQEITYQEGLRGTADLFENRGLKPGIDIEAIVTVSDTLSAAAVEQLRVLGIAVPHDIAVVGYNNRNESVTSVPPLTTLELNFEQHGYQAVTSLLQLLLGREVPAQILMPVKTIIRQSCGCYEGIIRKAGIPPAMAGQPLDAPEKQWVTAIKQNRPALIAKMKPLIGKIIDKDHPALLDNLIKQFILDLTAAGTGKGLLKAVSEHLDSLHTPQDIVYAQNLISALRIGLWPQLPPDKLNQAENLAHQARTLICKTLEYRPAIPGYSAPGLVQVGGAFNTSLTYDELIEVIERDLPKLGIPGCYLALYQELGAAEPLTAELIFAMDDNRRLPLADSQRSPYPCYKLLPDGILPADRRYTLLVQSCFYKGDQLGLVVFEMGPLEGVVYEMLRTNFSSALHSVLMSQARIAAERDREELLKALAAKNTELEDRNADFRQVNEQLQAAITEANKANQAKSRFLANMSHEIRTPLNCIIGFAEILNTAKNPSQRQHYTQLIIEESEKLMELINHTLDISTIEAGKLRINHEPFDLYQLMESITSTYAVHSRNKGLEYECAIDPALHQTLQGDPLRLRQVLINLIGNAIKFTFQGKITVDVHLLEQNETSVTLLFQICDTGIGIPPEQQSLIFDAFVQAEDSTTRKFGGTGLGTAISKELVHLMGGTIGVHSKVGQGSVFWFSLPLTLVTPGSEPRHHGVGGAETEPLPLLTGSTVLLVEDYPTNQEVAMAHLDRLGCNVVIADNGKVAVELYQNLHADLVLMDIQMPEMDGFEATRLIRQQPNGQTVPILGMTANAFASDVQLCLDAGMNDVITKPFRKEFFQRKVVFWLKDRDTPPPLSRPGHTGPERPSPTKRLELPKSTEPIDMPLALQEFENDYQLLEQLITLFIGNCRKQCGQIDAALAKTDLETVRREAHSIKGGALNLRANDLGKIAQALERQAKSLDLPGASATLPQLQAELERLAVYSESYQFPVSPSQN